MYTHVTYRVYTYMYIASCIAYSEATPMEQIAYDHGQAILHVLQFIFALLVMLHELLLPDYV